MAHPYPRTQPIPKDVVDGLHSVRLNRDDGVGITYDVLADELDMPRSNVIRLMTERGARVSARTLTRLRDYLAKHRKLIDKVAVAVFIAMFGRP